MASSPTPNAATMQPSYRVQERQPRMSVQPPSRASSRLQTRYPDNVSIVETMSIGSNPERRPVQLHDTRPPWNGSSVARPTKVPRSVFLDAPTVEQGPPRQSYTASSMHRPTSSMETTAPVRVVHVPQTIVEQSRPYPMPVYTQQPQQIYQPTTKMIRTDPEVIVMESQSSRRSCCNCFRRKRGYPSRYYGDQEGLLHHPESPVYRGCECCARGRLASRCPSCYFCELFYGCPLYCWILTFLLLLLPMLALFGWFLSEQPALNPAKRRYVTQQSSVVQNDVYAVMRNCAVPYCTITSPATTINQLYLTFHDYSVTQVTSAGSTLSTYSWIVLPLLAFLKYFSELI